MVITSTTTLNVVILVITVFGAGLAEDDGYIINLYLWFSVIYIYIKHSLICKQPGALCYEDHRAYLPQA